jgi:carbohydrate-binding DOMON domain-containing protein
VTLWSCAFQLNAFDYFLGTSSSYTVNIMFINCVFDVQSLNKTNSVSFSTADCTYETRPTLLADCPTRTPMQSPTSTISRTPAETRTPTMSRTAIRTVTRSPAGSQTPSFTSALDILSRQKRVFLRFGPFTLALVLL